MLADLGAEVTYHDPHVPQVAELGLESVGLEAGLGACDLAVIVTAHDEIDPEVVVAKAERVLDLRGVTREIDADHVVRL